jgi:hypothetical protein
MLGSLQTYSQLRHYCWQAGDLSYKLWPQQIPIYDTIRNKIPSHVNEVVILCARQFGKSHEGVLLAVEDCLRYPNTCILIMGPTLKQTVGIVTPRLKEIGKDAPPDIIKPCKSESKWIVGSSELVIGGMDLNSGAQRGKTLQNVYIEEIVDSDPDLYLEALRSDVGPALTHSQGGKIFFLTTVPKIPDHPFLLETVPAAELNGALFKYTIYDNKKIDDEQFRRCAELAGCKLGVGREILHKTVEWDREYLCVPSRDSSILIAPEFDELRHVKAMELPECYNAWTSGDSGGVRDKTVFHLVFYDFRRNKVCFFDERAFCHDTASTVFVPQVFAMEAPYRVKSRWVDAPGQLQIDWMSALAFPVSVPRKDEFEASINQLRVGLARDEIEVHPRCKLLITTLRSGTFNKQRTDFERSTLLGHADAAMSCIYGYRHANRANPYPLLGNANPHTHYISDDALKQESQSAKTIKSLFVTGR